MCLSSFNSILVRLKAVSRDDIGGGFIKFQFHTGSIKSLREIAGKDTLEEGFNSILVRLKVFLHAMKYYYYDRVSIPYWFD